MNQNNKLSKCCGKPVAVQSGVDGTSYWTCDGCGNPCDLKVQPTISEFTAMPDDQKRPIIENAINEANREQRKAVEPTDDEWLAEVLAQLQYGTTMSDNAEPMLTNNREVARKAISRQIEIEKLRARIHEHSLVQHQARVNLSSVKAVFGWSQELVKQLKDQLAEKEASSNAD